MNEKYWRESLQECFSDHGIQLSEGLATDIMQIADMESEACGYSSIPNPMKMELDQCKKDLSSERDKHSMELYSIATNYADAHNMSRDRVFVDKGKLMFVHGR